MGWAEGIVERGRSFYNQNLIAKNSYATWLLVLRGEQL
jgi:hypothetical protein